MEKDKLIAQLRHENDQLQKEIVHLKKEVAYLKEQFANAFNPKTPMKKSVDEPPLVTKQSSLDAKIRLFRSLFNGRNDVYARRWESKSSGKAGYSPACAYEWNPPICQKPQISCQTCQNRKFLPLTDQVIQRHLDGKIVVGLYPMHHDETCSFLAVDFDKKQWQEDVIAFTHICQKFRIPYSVERSRSGNGAHVWFFFSSKIKASIARKLGFSLLSKTLEMRHEIGLDSFDRMFPNQDTLSKNGFGNLIALPLQPQAAIKGNSLFIDEYFNPYPDQWIYLSNVKRLSAGDISNLIKKLQGEQLQESTLSYSMPKKLKITLKNGFFLKKKELPSSLITKLIDLATFANPEFYKAQKRRFSTKGIPRMINCSEEDAEHLILPRGCQQDIEKVLKEFKIEIEYEDLRYEGEPLPITFTGQLTSLQTDALSQLLLYENGVLSATTGFGKTVIAAALMAEREVNTLIIVDRTQLQLQWIEKLSAFLNISSKDIGQLGGGKNKLTGKIDVVTIQSLTSKQELKSFITQYGQIIVDECHHISAFTFEQVLKQVRTKYIHGLTATPIRKDGLHPIIFMQCGPIQYKVDSKTQAKVRPFLHRLIIRKTTFTTDSTNLGEIYQQIASDEKRNQQLFDDVLHSLDEGRSPIILTERVEHLERLKKQFKGFAKNVIVLSGHPSKKEQQAELERLASIPDGEERLVIATGKYIGEGFDDARLDTLFLAMPISWKGTLQQYVGRLHRLHENKQEVRVYDYVDIQVPILDKMFIKRQSGYKHIGYVTVDKTSGIAEQMRLF